MKRPLTILLSSALAACGSDPSGPGSVTCGTGTVENNGVCVPSGGTTCGTGTHDESGTCVPDAPGDVGAPTIASISPGAAGISGGTVFVIDGTNFAGQGAGTATVKFGDQDAEVAAISETKIAGTIPPGVSITTTVTVTTSKGSATTPFKYLALYAAEGRGMPDGYLFLVDPTNGFWGLIDVLNDGTNTYGLTGLAFAQDGTLYGSTAAGPSGAADSSQLVTVDPATAVVTVVGTLTDGAAEHHIADLKFSGGVLYGNSGNGGLVTIDTTTAALTVLGDNLTIGGGMVFDANGTLLSSYPGELDSTDLGTGDLTVGPTVDYGVNVNAMANIEGVLVGSFDNSTTGNQAGDDLASTRSLAAIDPTTGATSWISEMPAFEGYQSQIDAIATAPDTLVLAHDHPIQWRAPRPRATTVATRTAACTGTVVARGHQVALRHHQQVAIGTGAARVTTCDGTTLALTDASHYVLVGKRRGGVKLVDTLTHRTVLRGVQTID